MAAKFKGLAKKKKKSVNMQIILGSGRHLPLRPGLTQVAFRSPLLFLLSIYELRRVAPYIVEVVMFAHIDVSLLSSHTTNEVA